MLRHVLITGCAAALVAGSSGSAQALLSAPEVIYKGVAINADKGNTVTLEITLNGVTTSVASGTVGEGRRYILRVPMETNGTRKFKAAQQGEQGTIKVNGIPVKEVTIPPFGTVVDLEVGSRTEEQWAKDHPGNDGSGDMNRNGINDLNEYLSGKDPAGCVWTVIDSIYAETAVYHQDVLKNCLAEAGGDGRHNLVRLARGNYAGDFSYTTLWGESFDLTLIGGFDPDHTKGTTERNPDPALTVLGSLTDENGLSTGSVLAIDTDLNKSTGKVRLESLAIKNGKAPTGKYGGGIRARIYKGDLELIGNMISGNSTSDLADNTANAGGGVSVESSDSGAVFLANNVIYGNSAANGAAVRIVPSGSGAVTLLNNTIADNLATAAGDGRSLLIKSSTTAGIDLTNNIISGVSGLSGKDIHVNSSGVSIPVTVRNNGYDQTEGLFVNAAGFVAGAGNTGDAPQFVSAAGGNYRLANSSTLIDKGIGHAKLPEKDVAGGDRISGIGVDPGAYELQVLSVKTFAAIPRANYLIADITITASNPATVKEYCVTETADGSGCSWVTPAPAIFTFATAGEKNLYAFVRDLGDKVSEPRAANLTVSIPNLEVVVGGSGTGTVSSTPGGITCDKPYSNGAAVSCSKTFSGDVILTATTSTASTFGGWGGTVCSGLLSTCTVTMDAAKTVTAAFNLAATLQIGTTPYATLQEAYDAAASDDEIKLLDNSAAGTLDANQNITVKLKGGYDSAYNTNTGTTAVTAPLTIRQGTLVVDKIVIK